ncbi:MAG: hypothetical protein CMN72_00245 [Sphingomonas sp.]|nr:hypothetical protein [Sphingomonas sp.]|tara:strand:- start:5251 stop:5868 length:618 start_codon:yes stop_codon:yes gene_type:complete
MKSSKKISHLKNLADKRSKKKKKEKLANIADTPFVSRERFVKEYSAKRRDNNSDFFYIMLYSFAIILLHMFLVSMPMSAYADGIYSLSAVNFTSLLAFISIGFLLTKITSIYSRLSKKNWFLIIPSLIPFFLASVFLFFSFSEFVRNIVLVISGHHFSFGGLSIFESIYEAYVYFCYSFEFLHLFIFVSLSGSAASSKLALEEYE